MYPGCEFKGRKNIFSRSVDLERHLKNVHGTENEKFRCDYYKCLSRDPFYPQDHLRDHFRDFHKEDIGCYAMMSEVEKIEDFLKIWLAERNIEYKWWRCGRCLFKNYVAIGGWNCVSCRHYCEEDRVKTRQELNLGDAGGGIIGHTAPGLSNHQTCVVCNGFGWIDGYVLCTSRHHTDLELGIRRPIFPRYPPS
jgi:hypothetical protein